MELGIWLSRVSMLNSPNLWENVQVATHKQNPYVYRSLEKLPNMLGIFNDL